MLVVGYSKETHEVCDNCGTHIKHEFHMSDGRIFGCCCAAAATDFPRATVQDLIRKAQEHRREQRRREGIKAEAEWIRAKGLPVPDWYRQYLD